MKTFKELREASCGYKMGPPKPKREDATDDAIAAFKAKGGKIKKLPPAKAAGYHGKDDPGKGMHGMMDKGDTKAIGTRKKVKSMGEDADTARMYKDNPEMMKKGGPGGYKGLNKAGKKDVKKAMNTELTHDTMNKYYDKAKKSLHHAKKKLDTGEITGKIGTAKDKATVNKRIAGIKLAKARTLKKSKDEGYVSAAQRKAVWASRADGGKGHPKNKGKK
tara:strand:- start:2347 stop:3003 length:657 start_codon:yes stop_codon:yes gene_type:complete